MLPPITNSTELLRIPGYLCLVWSYGEETGTGDTIIQLSRSRTRQPFIFKWLTYTHVNFKEI